MTITSITHITRSAEQAAMNNLGSRANPYPEGNVAFDEWLSKYYSAVLLAAEECVQ